MSGLPSPRRLRDDRGLLNETTEARDLAPTPDRHLSDLELRRLEFTLSFGFVDVLADFLQQRSCRTHFCLLSRHFLPFCFKNKRSKTDLRNWRKEFPVNKEHFCFGHKIVTVRESCAILTSFWQAHLGSLVVRNSSGSRAEVLTMTTIPSACHPGDGSNE